MNLRPFKPVPPGEILAEEASANDVEPRALALALRLTDQELEDIFQGKAAVGPCLAARLARLFGTSAVFWLNLQNMYDEDKKPKVSWRYGRCPNCGDS